MLILIQNFPTSLTLLSVFTVLSEPLSSLLLTKNLRVVIFTVSPKDFFIYVTSTEKKQAPLTVAPSSREITLSLFSFFPPATQR
jgi:hypothetical protein